MTSKPDAIVTRHLIRNILVTLVVIVVATCGVLWWKNVLDRKPAIDTNVAEKDTSSNDQVIVEAEEPSVLDVEDAKSAVIDYYTLLAHNEFAGLRSRGFNEVAGAVELGWTRQIGLEVHPEFIIPDVTSMPDPVGTYAGNDLYDIRSFFTTTPPVQCVKSIVTGETGPVGWIYHDALEGQWHVIDPTIPLSTQAPVASSQSRKSIDNLVLVEMSSPGVFSNQWWSITIFTVGITSASRVANVSVMQRTFDEGITVEVPDTLKAGILVDSVPTVPTINPDGTTNPLVAKIFGVCTIWRGERQEFSRDLIGQSLQRLDGSDMSPIDVTAGAENVTPVFPIENRLAEMTANLLNEEQMKRYGVDGIIVTMPLIDQQAYEQNALGLNQQTDATTPQYDENGMMLEGFVTPSQTQSDEYTDSYNGQAYE